MTARIRSEAAVKDARSPDRREFLQAGAAAGVVAAGGLRGAELRAAAPFGTPAARRTVPDVLVAIFLRGGADGLSMCAPYADPNYAPARPGLAVPPPGSGANAALDLDCFFGLHPALAPLMPAYQAGDLLFVHATGTPNPSRSHFDMERVMEVGDDAGLLPSGWIGRHLATAAELVPGALLRGVGVRTSLPYSLGGGPKALPVPDLAAFGLLGSTTTAAARRATLAAMHNRVADPLRANANVTFATIDLLQAVNIAGYVPGGGAVYPVSGSLGAFGRALRGAAALIRAQVGVEAIAIDLGDFDTHGQQGTFGGTLASLLTALGQGLGAFYTDLMSGGAPGFTVVVVSEFGRTVLQNGSLGSDHGHGNAMMVLGPCIAGGRVLTIWPGLALPQLFQGRDLAVTIDYRDILAEVVQARLGNPNLAAVFPGYAPTLRGIASC